MGRPDKLTDGLTYRDLAGRRRLRRYVLAAAAIFILIGAIVYLGWQQRQSLLARGAGVPTSVSTAAQLAKETLIPTDSGPALVDTQPSPTTAPPTEASTVVPFDQTPTAVACPDDPSAWELLDIARNDNFKKINPPCVYEGLARTVAWDFLQVVGYSASEATKMLGFTDFPWRPLPEMIGMTNTQGPMPIALANPSDKEIRQASHPDFHSWIVDREGKPGVAFTLRGCYRTETIEGDRVESWGVAYPVVCVVTMDQGEWAVLELGSHRYTTNSLPTRRFFIYGYTGDGLWVSIGYQKEPFVEIRLPKSSNPAVLPLTMELEQIVQDRKFSAGLHGLTPWDQAWLEETFGVSMRPLPANWQGLNDPSEYQAIQDEKEKWVEERSP